MLAALLVLLPLGGGVHPALGTSLDELSTIRPVARWALESLELVLMCSCLVMLCLIAPRFRDRLEK